ncbi:MAG: hypothetical protein FJ044_00145 [Candidatus Cloacimonetes bacterium]|nr:hypothetical protein [Candidatus Cloacimonadota bacterium]
MTALASHKKLFLSILVLLLLIIAGRYFLLRETKTFQSTAVAVATLNIIPNQQSLSAGEEVELIIAVDTNGEAVNTVTANLSYPTDILEFVNLNLQDSFAKIWFEKKTSLPGEIRLTGSLPTPGFAGQGAFAKLTFRAKEKGKAQIAFTSNSAVFRNLDSLNILGQTENGLVEVE